VGPPVPHDTEAKHGVRAGPTDRAAVNWLVLGLALAVLTLLFTALLVVSWKRWGSVTVDCGVALDRAALVAGGALLYRDTLSAYGPVGAYAIATLFRIFGIHLNVAYGAGIALLLAESCLLWYISRRFLTALESAVGLAGFWMLAFQPGLFNWILPNTFAATFAVFFSTAAVALVIADLDRPDTRKLMGASLCTAAAGLSKVEFGAAAFGTMMAAAWLLRGDGRGRRRATAALVFPGLLLSAGVALTFASLVPWRQLVFDNVYRIRTFEIAEPAYLAFVLPSHAPIIQRALLQYGLVFPVAAALVAAGLHLAAAGGSRRSLGAVVVAGVLLVPFLSGHQLLSDFLPVGKPFVWAPMGWALVAAVALASNRRAGRVESRALFVVAIFNVLVALRWVLRVNWPAYYGFFAPFLVIFLVRVIVSLVAPRRAPIAVPLVVAAAVLSGAVSISRIYQDYSYVLEYPRGSIRTTPRAGEPLKEAIDHIRATTSPDDYVAVIPEERLINFLAERKSPTRDPAVWPGWLATTDDELGFIAELEQKDTDVVVLSQRRYPEFGLGAPATYNPRLMQYIMQEYRKIWTSSGGEYAVYRRDPSAARPDP